MSHGDVLFHDPAIAEGRFRYVYKGYQKANPSVAMVVKVFKKDTPMNVSALQPDLDVYKRADELAKRWNGEVVPKDTVAKRIYFREPGAGFMRQDDTSGLNRYRRNEYAFYEPYIEGAYQKFNSNAGWEGKDYATMGAFTHWTYEVTGHKFMVCDLQGVFNKYGTDGSGHHYLLTDPCVHSFYQEHRDALTDLGVVGMEMVLAGHICGDLCRALRLRKPRVPVHLARPNKYTSVNTAEDLTAEQRNRAAAGASVHIRLDTIQEEDEDVDDLVGAAGRFRL